MRRRFGKIISDLASKDRKIILIMYGYCIFNGYIKKHPDKLYIRHWSKHNRFASGAALSGLRPWVYTITPFLIERPFEQIKLDVNQQKANVNLVGFADYPSLGPTHSELNAKKLMSLMSNIKSFFPKNSIETEKFAKRMSKINGPTFMSLKTDKKIQKW